MYCEFYQLRERPFNVTPDPKFLYLNARYREAIASLHYGITQRKGFITLIGEAGTGKTTLLKRLLDELDQSTRTVFLFNTNVSFEEILEYMFAEFDLPVHSGKKLYMLQRLNMFLLEELRNGRNVALLIDEAQDLEYSVLEDLRLLSNLETAKEKIIQIVLSGQPELGQKLSNPVLRQLRQRISVNCRLLPLSRDEVSEYIRFRLEAAGAPDTRLFTREAEERIYQFSRGIPRLVNVVCDNALVIGYAMGKRRISADIIDEAAADLLPQDAAAAPAPGEPAGSREERPPGERTLPSQRRSWWQRLALGGAVVATGLAAWTAGRSVWQVYVASPSALEQAAMPPELTIGTPAAVGALARPAEEGGRGTKELEQSGEQLHDATTSAGRLLPDAQQSGDIAQAPPPVPSTPVPESKPARRLAMLADVPVESSWIPLQGEEVGALGEEGRRTADQELSGPEKREEIAEAVGRTRPVAQEQPVVGRDLQSDLEQAERSREGRAEPLASLSGGDRSTPHGPPPGTGAEIDVSQYANLVVRPGDSLSGIARAKYGQSSYTILDLIKLANPEIRDVDVIIPGQTLRLPDFREGPPIVREAPDRYALLVFSTPNAQRAQTLAQALRRRGFESQVRPAELGAQKKVFRVTVFAGAGREQALRTGATLQRVLREDAEIVRLGQ